MTEVVVVPGEEALVAEALLRLGRAAREVEGAFSVLLAGGSTPAPVHRALAAKADWPWWRTIVGFGDERCVPPQHEDSNFRAAQDDLLRQVAPAEVMRIPGEAPEASAGAALYADRLAALPRGRADLVFLGMGDDGHTASLFPGRPPIEDAEVAAVPQPGGAGHPRITVTERFLARAGEVVVLVSGEKKADRLAEVLAGGELPLARVLARRAGRPTVVIADAAAAAKLEDR